MAAALGAVLCLAAAAASQGPQGKGDVLSVRFGVDPAQTRVVIELAQGAKGELIDGSGVHGAVVLALPKLGVADDMAGRGQGLVSSWSVDSAAGAARVKLTLAHPAQVRRRFLLPPGDGISVYRYVIDLSPDTPPPAPIPTPNIPDATPRLIPASTIQTVQPMVTRANPTPAHLRKIIVIDPGHGGHDPGALGSVSREKDLSLAAARALKAKLERTGRYRVVMTRNSDTFIPLESRVEIARRAGADLFISLHCDSGPDPDMRGATVYTLSDKGSDRVSHNVMTQSDWFINVDLPGHDKAVNQILLDLTQRATRNRSDAFAEDLVDHIGDRAQTHGSHRDAGFMVLLAPDVPAVLLEMGYISNPEDERLLNSPTRREAFMGEVAASIEAYFNQATQLAAR
ncbi:MAG TPA: N-acetylmuramoyl-L-alanine amidase [Caulobacteraceae bacterium]|nr:N-acetylmuramoyl-L-alanine amidase [Caulobacteraceae bacterium]